MRRLLRLVAAEGMASARVIFGTLNHRRKPSLSIRISADEWCRDPHVCWRGDQPFRDAPTNAIATGWGSTLVANHPHSDVLSHLLQPRLTSFISATRPLSRFSTAMLRFRSITRSSTLQVALQPVSRLPPCHSLRIVVSWLPQPEVSEL